MPTGTCTVEQRVTAAEVDDPSSPSSKFFYVWHTFGLGGKTFPMVYARPASFASHSAQALMDPAEAKVQPYVDDPAVSMVGTEKWALTEGRISLLWWLVLGLKLSWKKGYFGDGAHEWIGVKYAIGYEGPTMELPPSYLQQTLDLLRPLSAPRGTNPTKLVHSALGRQLALAT